MSVEDYGRRILREIEEEPLDKILAELRELSRSTATTLNIPCIDRLLEIFLPAKQLLPFHTEEDDNAACEQERVQPPTSRKGRVIELTGTSTCSGKTHLLYYITAIAVLPPVFNHIPFGGKDGAVVVLDTDGRFDVHRLRDILTGYSMRKISEHLSTSDEENDVEIDWLQILVDQVLTHVHIFRPQSSSSLIETLNHLSSYLLQSPGHSSSARALSTIVLDSVSAFYWQDRQGEEETSLSGASGSRETPQFVQIYQTLVSLLRSLQDQFGCAIVASNWGLIPLRSHDNQLSRPSFRPHLPPVWTNFCTLRLIVERRLLPKFPPLYSVEEAMRDSAKRAEAQAQASFSTWVDRGWGSDAWTEAQKAQLKLVRGRGHFWFSIDEDGVTLED